MSRINLVVTPSGLMSELDEEVATYISRTSVSPHGAWARSRLAMDVFSSQWTDFTQEKQRIVL
ncbi:hypothetical protein B0H19DRAFT_1139834 [Mycena capillaripes]|nr:hypothetical protein B0H19DRAFT_1139834 [Mycena capillaripes]